MKELPRGIRNNNPGNVERTSERWLGMSEEQSDTRFMVFKTPEYGIRCLQRLLINYQERHQINTIRKIIDRWAPSVENNTSAYVWHISRITGFDPDESLDLLDKYTNIAITKAIVRHENGEPKSYNRNEWYDDATYERSAVMAGFAPEPKDLAKSRTMIGGAVAVATGATAVIAETIAVATDGVIQPQDVSTITSVLGSLIGPAAIAAVSPYMSLAAVIFMMYARWDDSRKKLR